MPHTLPVWQYDGFIVIVSTWFVISLLFGFSPLIYRTTYQMVDEKRSGLREALRRSGMGLAYWGSYFVVYLMKALITSLVAFIIVQNGLNRSSTGFFIWLPYFLFGISTFGQVVLV